MNACIIAYTFYELDYRVRRYAEALIEQGYNVDVIVLRRNNEDKEGILNKVNIYRLQERSFKEKNIISFLFNQLKFFILGSLFLLNRYITKRYKIIHIHNIPDFLIFMGLIPKLTGAKLILDIHDIVPEYYCQKFNKRFDSSLVKCLLFIEKISVRFADHVIVANDIWREKVIKRDSIAPNNCTTLLNYPQLKFFTNTINKQSNDKFTLIYPGTISELHGLDVAIKTISIVKKKIKTIQLNIYVLGGSLFLKNNIISMVKRLGLEENVTFFDPVPPEFLGKIMAKADIGIVPKRGGIFSDEAFSTKILEFMAAGIPVVASKTSIDKYYFDDSMIKFFEVENPDDMARCICELYEKPQLRDNLIRNSRKFIEENNWAIKKDSYFKIVSDLF